jgi:hypothetical protein
MVSPWEVLLAGLAVATTEMKKTSMAGPGPPMGSPSIRCLTHLFLQKCMDSDDCPYGVPFLDPRSLLYMTILAHIVGLGQFSEFFLGHD